MESISRKFLVKEMPDLKNVRFSHSVRFYLYRDAKRVVRIQSKDNSDFELERKSDRTDLIRVGETIQITKEEFNALSRFSSEKVERDSYVVHVNPRILLRIYHGKFEGLIRAEVTFENEEQAAVFLPETWMGREITDSPLAKEGKLLDLSEKEFRDLLND